MKIGLIGLSSSGKTTLFNLLTNAIEHSSGTAVKKMEPHIGVARVPDRRIDFLALKYKPKKTTYAAIDVIDIRGMNPEANAKKEAGQDNFLESVRQADALVHVVRAFQNDEVIHIEGSIDPLRDIDSVNMELLFADLAVIENRIHRIETSKKMTKELTEELEVLKKCRGCLESEKLIHSLDLTDDEKQYLKTFQFLTERPLVLLVNLDEDQFRTNKYENREKLIKYAAERDIPLLEICARTELEISQLDAEDKVLFMEDLCIKDTGISRLANLMYNYLGLISFLTVGEDEVRAWTVRKGITAKSAGGKIHSDIERGFIRAEVFKYSDFERLETVHAIKEKGLFRLEGKDYIIEDGDIINFRFNI
jgi:ribosome-binding ATPase